jgi:LPXTG-site transpeptidase (sortase) family protein
MNRLVSGLGGLLILTGIGILAYIGVTYARQSNVSVPGWSSGQHQTGNRIKTHLGGKQEVGLPSVKGSTRGDPAIRMAIPKIGVDSRIAQTAPSRGVWEVADWAVGHLTTTSNPGDQGNGAYAAHDDIKGELFKRLAELSPGDGVILYTKHATYRYSVVDQKIVDPSDIAVLNPTRQPTITLISCTPYWVDTQRLIVQAVLKSTSSA